MILPMEAFGRLSLKGIISVCFVEVVILKVESKGRMKYRKIQYETK